jgi:hypothetical protein
LSNIIVACLTHRTAFVLHPCPPLVLAAFGMKDMVNLRIVAICSNLAFITYALVLNLLPVLILHVVLLPLNI